MSKWASDDDANDLLAGILNETADDAAAEEAKVQAEIEAKLEAERSAKAQARAAKLAEADARISAERERQEKLNERRTAKMEALRIEDLKAKGEWVDPAEIARQQAEAEAQRRADEARLAAAMAEVTPQPTVQPIATIAPPPSNRGFGAVAVALALLGLIGAVGLTIGLTQSGYELDQTAYAKAVYSPKDTTVGQLDTAFEVIPKAAPAVSEPKTEQAERPKRNNRPKTNKPPKKQPKRDKVSDEAAARAKALQDALNDSSDVFGTQKQ